MLEDDVEVSALWWHWAQAGLRRYAHLPAVVGVSLFTPDDMNEAYENGGTNGAGGWEPSCGWQRKRRRHLPCGGRELTIEIGAAAEADLVAEWVGD